MVSDKIIRHFEGRRKIVIDVEASKDDDGLDVFFVQPKFHVRGGGLVNGKSFRTHHKEEVERFLLKNQGCLTKTGFTKAITFHQNKKVNDINEIW